MSSDSPTSRPSSQEAPTQIECDICNKPSSVVIRCPICERCHCQVCTESPLHACAAKAAAANEKLTSDGYEPLSEDTLVSVTKRICKCGQSFEGNFPSMTEAMETLAAWSSMHEGKGHQIKSANPDAPQQP